jgi:hypothetical protein
MSLVLHLAMERDGIHEKLDLLVGPPVPLAQAGIARHSMQIIPIAVEVISSNRPDYQAARICAGCPRAWMVALTYWPMSRTAFTAQSDCQAPECFIRHHGNSTTVFHALCAII